MCLCVGLNGRRSKDFDVVIHKQGEMTEFLFYKSETVDKHTYPTPNVRSKVGNVLKALIAIAGSVAKASAFNTTIKTDGVEATVVYIPTRPAA